MTTWEKCHAAGMTVYDAAKAMGRSTKAAYNWSGRHGLKWPLMTTEERSERIRAGLMKAGGQPRKRDARNDGGPVPPEQERQGGAFWMVNSKTGQRVTKASAAGLYLEAQLRGWLDWEWGQVK